jgi:hypothetical protein
LLDDDRLEELGDIEDGGEDDDGHDVPKDALPRTRALIKTWR